MSARAELEKLLAAIDHSGLHYIRYDDGCAEPAVVVYLGDCRFGTAEHVIMKVAVMFRYREVHDRYDPTIQQEVPFYTHPHLIARDDRGSVGGSFCLGSNATMFDAVYDSGDYGAMLAVSKAFANQLYPGSVYHEFTESAAGRVANRNKCFCISGNGATCDPCSRSPGVSPLSASAGYQCNVSAVKCADCSALVARWNTLDDGTILCEKCSTLYRGKPYRVADCVRAIEFTGLPVNAPSSMTVTCPDCGVVTLMKQRLCARASCRIKGAANGRQ